MEMARRILVTLACFLCFAPSCSRHYVDSPTESPPPADPGPALLGVPGVALEELPPDSGFVASYAITIRQPLDHTNPHAGVFDQRLILSHRRLDAPVVMITEGYALGRNHVRELSNILGANELRVEHRYFGGSKPDSISWRYLTLEQAASDYHRIVDLFATVYTGRWLSAGWSKGGQTALVHRSLYSADVVATVAYDAPLNFALEDPRIDAFFDEVGDSVCRARLIDFQRLVLRDKEQVFPLFRWYTRGRGYTYSLGEEKAFEYIVLEYPFSFWQYTKARCDEIPQEGASADEMLDHLRDVVSFSSYSDHALDSPAMYQFCTELGYYGYVSTHVADMLSCTDYPNCAYAPRDVECAYDPEPMQRLSDWLEKRGNNIIYLYGANDPWSAAAVGVSKQTNAVEYFLPGGNHYTFIDDFTGETREEIISILSGWIE